MFYMSGTTKMLLILLNIFLIFELSQQNSSESNESSMETSVTQNCQSKDYPNGTVCVCSSTYCDTISRPEPPNSGEFLLYTSNKEGLRFYKSTKQFKSHRKHNKLHNKIEINQEKQYQEVYGFGGAFTDATGYNLNLLPEEAQDNLLKAYFGAEGIEYNMGRVPMGGTDFSEKAYTYDDVDSPDPDLRNFKLAPDDYSYKIPYIQSANNLSNNDLRLFASAWTSPKWMKSNHNYSGTEVIKDEYLQTWADYFLKFFQEYQNVGIDFWGVTTGNEPSVSLYTDVPLETVTWSSYDMQNWIVNNLGPTIRSSNFSDLKLMILDDQRSFVPYFVAEILDNETAREYADGIAVHWYLDPQYPPELLTETHDLFPELFLLYAEATNKGYVDLGSWERGEYYSVDIIQDMFNWVVGWVDWNLVLDLEGGPNHIQNYCDAPIIINATSGEFYKQPMYYHLGHFSKFVPRGSVRINTEQTTDKIDVIAFLRPDNGIAVILLNRQDDSVLVNIQDETQGVASLELTQRSINTLLYW